MIVRPLQRRNVLIEVRLEVKLRRLLNQRVHQVLGQDFGESTHVEDVFLGVKRRQLPAELRQCIHYLSGGAPHAGIKRGEQPGRTAANDRDVGYLMSHRLPRNI